LFLYEDYEDPSRLNAATTFFMEIRFTSLGSDLTSNDDIFSCGRRRTRETNTAPIVSPFGSCLFHGFYDVDDFLSTRPRDHGGTHPGLISIPGHIVRLTFTNELLKAPFFVF
jgi:hypothetical protein